MEATMKRKIAENVYWVGKIDAEAVDTARSYGKAFVVKI